ncbi:uncharacterized serine-rich protein C215.13-like [Xenopus tropicalis]|uniref:Uncharacterized serine-rich protein C215.13-like n=1 Tax=Xenopus tropicalis TaxID=8364 RepID=A0A8J1JL33_XENTR|nr:uncharacterized serine-rich protein C215.13-like [Xenopus tropicalis]
MTPSVTQFTESTNTATETVPISTPSSSSTLFENASPDLTSSMSAESSTNVMLGSSSAHLFQNTASKMTTSTQPSSSEFQAVSIPSVTESDTSRGSSPSTPEHLPSSADELSTASTVAEHSTPASAIPTQSVPSGTSSTSTSEPATSSD